MNRYHGNIISFPDASNKKEVKEFIRKLPTRKRFLNRESFREIDNDLKHGRPVCFMPNDVVETNIRTDSGTRFELLLIGILKDGSKTVVVLRDIDVFMEVRVPDDVLPETFMHQLSNMEFNREDKKIYPGKMRIVRKYPFKGYHEHTVPYIKVQFGTTWARKSFIQCLNEKDVNYENSSGERVATRLSTASDDLTCYYRKAAREYGFKLCDWNMIKKYKIDQSRDSYAKPNSVQHTIIVSVKNFTDPLADGMDIPSDPIKYRDYIRDRTMEMSWDLETEGNGNGAPDPIRVFNEDGTEADRVFMGACSFSWYQETKPFLTVNITDMPTVARDDCMIIVCKNQLDIIYCFTMLTERMAPDFVTAFNDGLYDWPFLLRRAERYDKIHKKGIMNFMKESMSCLRMQDSIKWAVRGPKIEKIKIEANMYAENELFEVPGFHCIDVRTVFRQLFPQAEKSNLNFYLAMNKLGSKEDMPYQVMFKVYKLLRILWSFLRSKGLISENVPPAEGYEHIMKYLKAAIVELGADYKLFPHIYTKSEASPLVMEQEWRRRLDNQIFNLGDMTLEEIYSVVDKATDVVHYCNIDARRCHDLLHIRNVIADKREIANLSFTSMSDALYRAGGVKIRNLCMAEGLKPAWNIAFSCISSGVKDNRKYPGAFVVPPKKGLYRDHRSVKMRRRQSFQIDKSLPEEFTHTDVDPKRIQKYLMDQDPDLGAALKLLFDSMAQETYKPDNAGNEQSSFSDRPTAGKDFSSLYPMIIVTYNLSPEKVVETRAQMEALRAKLDKFGKPYKFIHVRFRYGLSDQAEDEKELVECWFVQHHPIETMNQAGKMEFTEYQGMGLLPYVLKRLFDVRSGVKRRMDYYSGPKEFLEKFFEFCSKSQLANMPVAEQNAMLVEFIRKELEIREHEYQQSGKMFHKYKVDAVREASKFFHKEYFSRFAEDESVRNQVRTCVADDILSLYEECSFFFIYFNSKQLGLKVFMNTAYGETGNSLSPFFIKHLAGAVTTYGQKNLKMIKTYVESRGWDVKYGDTDSLYVSPPEACFADVDALYESGEITKKDYWTRMIEITMEQMDALCKETAEILYHDNGTRFLKMLYEEVIFPYIFVGKKKYAGVQHQGIVNLSICMPECTLAEFSKSKSLFLRGLEVKKRGTSELLKQLCFEIMKEAFCIETVKTFKQIVLDKLREITTREFAKETFIKSARYRLPGFNENTGKPKPGNVSVLTFVKRMAELKQMYPDSGVEPPEVEERFNYIINRIDGYRYDLRGRKMVVKVGDRMEYFTNVGNTDYEKLVGYPVVPDIDYYITGELCGQFARFIIYHPEYDKIDEVLAGRNLDTMSIDEYDELYKEADNKSHHAAKLGLQKYYTSNFARQVPSYGKQYQRLFRSTNKAFMQLLEVKYGGCADVFNIIDLVVTGTSAKDASFESKLLARFDAFSKKGIKVDRNFSSLTKKNIDALYEQFVKIKENKMQKAHDTCEERIKEIKVDMQKLFPQLMKICNANLAMLQNMVIHVKERVGVHIQNLEDVSDYVDMQELIATNSSSLEVDTEVIKRIHKLYTRIRKFREKQAKIDAYIEEIKYRHMTKHGYKLMPPSMKKQNIGEDLETWLSKRKK
jgi:DNA polymerase elongation subunit (family B)